MHWLWTWGGKCFGYRDGDDLWTYNGKHVGRFVGNSVFDPHGRYLGEIRSGNRLITARNKAHLRSGSFAPWAKRVAYAKYVDYVGYVMIMGCEDFPGPESF